jgi:tetratricopeptide (TPR) repeat protein
MLSTMKYTKYLHLLCLAFAAHAAAFESGSLCFPKEDFQTSNEQLNRANELFEAALHTKAIAAYKRFIEDEKDADLLMLSRFLLAQVYFSMGNFQDTLSTLNENLYHAREGLLNFDSARRSQIEALRSDRRSPAPRGQGEEEDRFGKVAASQNLANLPEHGITQENTTKLKQHSLYLKALALKNLGKSDSAKQTFSAYSNTKASLFHDEALFEIALIDFNQGDYKEAENILKSIDQRNKPRLYALAQLHLARIELAENHYEEANDILKTIFPSIASNDPLFFELQYLLGETAFHLHDYANAIKSFNQALPIEFPEKYPWYSNTLLHLGWSYFNIGNTQQAEKTFERLLSFSNDENTALALAQCYLTLKNCTKAEEILSRPNILISPEAKAHALLLRAEAAPTYAARDQLYKQLTEAPSPYYAQGWYMRALNDFEHGAFAQAAKEFEKAFELLQEKDPQQAGNALKYQALATAYSSTSDAFKILNDLQNRPDIWSAYPNKEEIYFLQGFFSDNLETARQWLLAAASAPASLFGDQALSHLGALFYKNKEYEKAEEAYQLLIQSYPASPLAAEAWVWAASCADRLQKEQGKERRKYAYEHFPDSPFAAEAFFTYYTYPEYLQGDRTAIKHLQTFTDRYADSPFLIDAHYLIGLDYKRDRKTPEGRWIRKKSLTDAIDSFQKAETVFDELSEKKRIPAEKLEYYTAMRYRSTLERAMANLAIADEAQGAKKQIYLNYAEEVFKNLRDNPFPLIDEECSFGLAQTYIKSGKDNEAGCILSDMVNVAKGYYLARAREEQGRIAMRREEYRQALDYFRMAEEAAKGHILSADQKLDLWIQQSLAYRGLGQFDDAILILSKVVNDDAVSSLRMKAMYLRAETYELQKRPDLARKQLESMVKKGGIWARKAQEKLDKENLSYGH